MKHEPASAVREDPAEYHHRWLDVARAIVLAQLEGLPVTVFLFGSAADGSQRRDSDLDIGLLPDEGNVDPLVLEAIREALEESIVPWRVDLVDFSRVTDETFKRHALSRILLWKKSPRCPLG